MKIIINTFLTCCVLIALFSCHKDTYENDNTPTILWTEYINNNENQHDNYPPGTRIVAHYSDNSIAYFSSWIEENEINCIGNLFNKESYIFVVPETILVREDPHRPPISLSVVSLGGNAFDSRITSITLPNSIKRIGPNTFKGCSSLTSFTVPNSIQEIDSCAFEGCSLEMVTIEHNYIKESLFKDVFKNCSTGSLVLLFNGGWLMQIGRNAFEGCSSFTNVIFPDGLATIGDETFKGCSALTNVIFPDGLKEIGSEAFEDCSSLTNISLPNSIKKVDQYAFDNCPLETITIREGIDTIKGSAFNDAFYHCSSQSLSIILPEGLRFIGKKAFANCISLTSCTCYAVNPPTLAFYPYSLPWLNIYPDYPFDNTSLQAIYVPRESVEAYKTAEGWEHYADIICPIE